MIFQESFFMFKFQPLSPSQYVQTGRGGVSEFQTPFQESFFTRPAQEELSSEASFPLEKAIRRLQKELLTSTLKPWQASPGGSYVCGVSEFQTPFQQSLFTWPTQEELPSADGIPLESEPHRLQMELLIDTLRPWLASHGGGYVSGDMFLYFCEAQLRGESFRGPDVFVVLGVPDCERNSWVVWEEGKGPEVVVELISEETAEYDKDEKKRIYQDHLRVAEYFWFDPWNTDDWAGFELVDGQYREIVVDANTRLLSKKLGLMLVRWQGVHKNRERTWLRWATWDGNWLPTAEELVEAGRAARQVAFQWAEVESLARQAAEHRAITAEAEIAHLKALLAQNLDLRI
jgi:Uma2 family endonuclease